MKSGNYKKKKYVNHLVLDFSLRGNLPALGFFSEEEHPAILVFYSNFKAISSLRTKLAQNYHAMFTPFVFNGFTRRFH